MSYHRLIFSVLLLFFISSIVAQNVNIKGDLFKWNKITLELTGPQATEIDATFKDIRMDVTFTHVSSGSSLTVPG